MKRMILVVAAAAILATSLQSCAGCSESGRKSTEPKTFLTVKVIAADEANPGDSQVFLVDTNGDGKVDQELVSSSGKILHKGDSVILVIQGGIAVDWFK